MFKESLSRFFKKEVITLMDRSIVFDFNREIGECIEYFEKNSPNSHNHKTNLRLVHGSRVEIGRVKDKEKEFYFVQQSTFEQGFPVYKDIYTVDKGKVVRTRKSYIKDKVIENSDSGAIDRKALEKIVNAIHNITIPYKNHIVSKTKAKA